MKRVIGTLCLLALTTALNLNAQVNPYKDGTPGVTGYRSEVLAEVMIQEDKFVRLAEAIPADKYTWRPGADVRSVAEVFLHVSAANFNLYKMVGTPPPANVDLKNLEKSTTDKATVVATLKDSFAHAKKAITAMPDADLEKSVDWFGGKNTQRGILLFIVRHAAEHLGQQIAYTRMVGVVPPWTEDAQKAKAAAAPAKPKQITTVPHLARIGGGRSSGEGDKTRPQLKISMKSTKLLLAIALFSPTTWSQSKPETAVAGAWEGTSLCTVPNSPCHDEHVVLHIKADLKDSSKFSIDADKIVNGEEEFMGTLSCVYTAAKSELYCDNPGIGASRSPATRWWEP